jgi:predicted neutral ceramidase superfamily lipid hydrolase
MKLSVMSDPRLISEFQTHNIDMDTNNIIKGFRFRIRNNMCNICMHVVIQCHVSNHAANKVLSFMHL